MCGFYQALDEWEIDRESVVINRKLGEGAFGMVYGGESCLGRETDKRWVRFSQFSWIDMVFRYSLVVGGYSS